MEVQDRRAQRHRDADQDGAEDEVSGAEKQRQMTTGRMGLGLIRDWPRQANKFKPVAI